MQRGKTASDQWKSGKASKTQWIFRFHKLQVKYSETLVLCMLPRNKSRSTMKTGATVYTSIWGKFAWSRYACHCKRVLCNSWYLFYCYFEVLCILSRLNWSCSMLTYQSMSSNWAFLGLTLTHQRSERRRWCPRCHHWLSQTGQLGRFVQMWSHRRPSRHGKWWRTPQNLMNHAKSRL